MEDPDVLDKADGTGRSFSNRSGNNTKFSRLDYEDDVSIVAVLGRE